VVYEFVMVVEEFVRVVKWWREGCYGGEDEEKS
jgi:hypothetical protein